MQEYGEQIKLPEKNARKKFLPKRKSIARKKLRKKSEKYISINARISRAKKWLEING